jgi:hypothetical protein
MKYIFDRSRTRFHDKNLHQNCSNFNKKSPVNSEVLLHLKNIESPVKMAKNINVIKSTYTWSYLLDTFLKGVPRLAKNMSFCKCLSSIEGPSTFHFICENSCTFYYIYIFCHLNRAFNIFQV